MDIDEIYKRYITDTSILTLRQLSKQFGFGSKKYIKMCNSLYESYGKDHIKSISNKRMSQYRLKIRNSKPVKYSDDSKQKMSIAQKQVWSTDDGTRSRLSAELIAKYAFPKTKTAESRKKAVETRRNNGWPGHTEKWQQSVRKSNKTRIISNETRQKMRLSAINRMNERYGQVSPNYNLVACQLFEDINRELGWNGQHAENGGEFFIKELGYWVDYYEPNRNIVIEFDERHHIRQQEKDKQREQQITQFLNCKFLRITDTMKREFIYESCRKIEDVL
jgi:hypothetical protein